MTTVPTKTIGTAVTRGSKGGWTSLAITGSGSRPRGSTYIVASGPWPVTLMLNPHLIASYNLSLSLSRNFELHFQLIKFVFE